MVKKCYGKKRKERYTVMFKKYHELLAISKRKSEKTKRKFLNPQAREAGKSKNKIKKKKTTTMKAKQSKTCVSLHL